MKKFITERKWDKLYDQATDGFYEKKFADGTERYTIEGFNKYMKAVSEFPEYRIIGIRHQLRVLKDKWKEYKLRHLRIGKVKMLDKNNRVDFKIVDIDWDVHWQTNLYLTVIIRDYLRFFIKNTLAIGICVLPENRDAFYKATDDDWKKWESLVNTVADEFDELVEIYKEFDHTDNVLEVNKRCKALTKKAFSDLAEIYDDLEW